MNLIFNIILPYVGLTICNIKTYRQIKDYEQRLLNGFLSITYYRTSRTISNQTRTSYISEENDVEMELNEKMDSTDPQPNIQEGLKILVIQSNKALGN